MNLIGFELAQLGQVHPVDQHPVEPRLHVLEALLITDCVVSQRTGQAVLSD
jgi:hypothetical protein